MVTQKFQTFSEDVAHIKSGPVFPNPFLEPPSTLAIKACKQLQEYLKITSDLNHNFGLGDGEEFKDKKALGKMFGVLVVAYKSEVGFIAAFSGKLGGGNHHDYFVPPVFDSLKKDGFLNLGMPKLAVLSAEIKRLETSSNNASSGKIRELKKERKNLSHTLQHQLFDSYHFINSKGASKSAWEVFEVDKEKRKIPPAGAGECAAPKLFQFAFQHNLKPLALAEFWWGVPTKSEAQTHLQFYPPCEHKCRPILSFMLEGICEIVKAKK